MKQKLTINKYNILKKKSNSIFKERFIERFSRKLTKLRKR